MMVMNDSHIRYNVECMHSQATNYNDNVIDHTFHNLYIWRSNYGRSCTIVIDTLDTFIIQAEIHCDVEPWSVTAISFYPNTLSSDAVATGSGMNESTMTKNYFTAGFSTPTS